MALSPAFIAIAHFYLTKTKALGERFLEHCLSCGKCKHVGDEDMSVYLCLEAQELAKAFEEAKIESSGYAKAVGVDLERAK